MSNDVLLLIVEDESLVALTLQDALEAGGYSVVTAADGDEARATLERQAVALSALITDIRLGPGPDGWEVARLGRELKPDLPVVYTTAESADAWPVNGVPNSILIQKPYAPAQVIAAVSTLINKSDAVRAVSDPHQQPES